MLTIFDIVLIIVAIITANICIVLMELFYQTCSNWAILILLSDTQCHFSLNVMNMYLPQVKNRAANSRSKLINGEKYKYFWERKIKWALWRSNLFNVLWLIIEDCKNSSTSNTYHCMKFQLFLTINQYRVGQRMCEEPWNFVGILLKKIHIKIMTF